MVVSLDKDVEDFVRAQVHNGVSDDASGLVNDLLRAFRDQRTDPLTVTPELEAWLLEAADQPASPLSAADFDGIRKRMRA